MIICANTKYGNIFVYDNDWIGSVLLRGDYFEEELINLILPNIRENSTVLDIGANVGVFSKAFLTKNCTVYAFEPQILLINLLNKTFNNESNIIIKHNAIGDISKNVTMSLRDGNGNSFSENGVINLGGISIGFGG